MVNTGSIPVGPSHSEMRLLIHPGDVLKSGPKAQRILTSDLNLEGMTEQSTDFFYSEVSEAGYMEEVFLRKGGTAECDEENAMRR